MNHYDAWSRVAGDVLIVFAYGSGPVFFMLSGFILAKGQRLSEDAEDFAWVTTLAIVATVVAHMISMGSIK